MKILVIGKQGQLSRSLVERAGASDDVDLVALGRDRIDLERPGGLAESIAAEKPEVVINTAAYTAVDEAEDDEARAFAINATGAGAAASASAEAGARFIHISTDYVFDGSGKEARDETAPPGPLGAYGRSKLAGEEAVRTADPHALMIRTAWLYSPFGHNFVRTMMNAAKTRDELRVVDDQQGNPTNALDLADALLVAARQSWTSGDLFHVAGKGDASWAGFAEAIMAECAHLGQPSARIVPIPSSDYPTRAERPRNSMLDSRRFQDAFGFVMPDWRKSLPPVIERLARG
jgi:dTDP-4-dehydrorhamnose reductase